MLIRKTRKIVLVEDDLDDQALFKEILSEIKRENSLVIFNDGDEAFQYLETIQEKPFMVISDINMPKLSRMELKRKINNNKQMDLGCVPFVFLSTSSDQKVIFEAYHLSIQGFFTKPVRHEEFKTLVTKLVDYWETSVKLSVEWRIDWLSAFSYQQSGDPFDKRFLLIADT